MAYNLNQVAMFTGMTTRTLRNYLKLGILKGEKIDGNWSFTEEELEDFWMDPAVRKTIASKHHAVIYDFLTDPFKKTNRTCVIMDCPVSLEEALGIAKFFGEEMNRHGSDMEFRYIQEKNFARFILSGPEDLVADFMKAYYER